jgi:hypothetical protein
MPDVAIFDKYGNTKTWDWLVEEFGPIEINNPLESAAWTVAELHENDDIMPEGPQAHAMTHPHRTGPLARAGILAPSCVIVAVIDEDREPVSGIDVVWWYTTAPAQPGAGWHQQGDLGRTKIENGCVDFAMGGGAYYDPKKVKGPHDLWIHAAFGPCQLLSGLGMIAGTNHRHLDVVLQRVDPNMPPYPPPDLPAATLKICDALQELTTARDAVATADRRLQEALDALRRSCLQ